MDALLMDAWHIIYAIVTLLFIVFTFGIIAISILIVIITYRVIKNLFK